MTGQDYLSDIIEFLHDKVGQTYKQIGKKIGLSESMISRVANGKRALSLERFIKISEAYKIPIPVLLVVAVKEEHIPKQLRPGYEEVRKAARLVYAKKD